MVEWPLVVSRVSGQVSYSDGRAASAASVQAAGFGSNADESGRYAIYGLPSGNVSVTASEYWSSPDYGGLSASTETTLVGPQAAAVADLVFPPTGQVVGKVLGADGQPLSWADVSVHSTGLAYGPSVNTDVDGTFAFPTIALGNLVVSAYHGESGNAISTNEVLSSAGQQVSVALQMKPLTRLTGVVKKPDGTPAVDAYVVVTMADRTGAMSRVRLTTRTNSAGEFSVEGVPRGQVKVASDWEDASGDYYEGEVLGDTDIAGELSLDVLLK